jgi:hypothetical protein
MKFWGFMKIVCIAVSLLLAFNSYVQQTYGELFVEERDDGERVWSSQLDLSFVVDNDFVNTTIYGLVVEREINPFFRLAGHLRSYQNDDSELLDFYRRENIRIEPTQVKRSLHLGIGTTPFYSNLNFYNTRFFRAMIDLDLGFGVSELEVAAAESHLVESYYIGAGLRFYFTEKVFSKISFIRYSHDFLNTNRFNTNNLAFAMGIDF